MLRLACVCLMIRRPPRSPLDRSSAASDVYKRQADGLGDDVGQGGVLQLDEAARGDPVGDIGEPLRPCLLYTSPSPRDRTRSRMPSSA